MQFTGGHWEVYVDALWLVCIASDDGMVVDRIGELIDGAGTDNEILMNDAYLLARAKDMFELLEEIVPQIPFAPSEIHDRWEHIYDEIHGDRDAKWIDEFEKKGDPSD